MAVRPQPRQMSSNSVEQTATQGESEAINAFCDGSASPGAAASPLRVGRGLLIRRSLASVVRPLLHSPDRESGYRAGSRLLLTVK